MPKRYCKCPNEHCFDRAIQCVSCDTENLDPEGYPDKARRRLTNEDKNGMVMDIDTKQKFKVKKVKNSLKRLVPQFSGPVDWQSAKGYAAMLLFLSCLGAEGVYVLWDENTNAEMTEKEWRKRMFRATSNPPVRHSICGEMVRRTCIANLQQGGRIGCPKCHAGCNPWSNRYDEFMEFLPDGYELAMSRDEWKQKCISVHWNPPIRCVKHKRTITTTSISNLRKRGTVGCPSCMHELGIGNQATPWSDRYEEFIGCIPKGYVLTLNVDEWREQCSGNEFCPPLRCDKHGQLVTTTSISNLRKRGTVGCTECHPHMINWSERYEEAVDILPNGYSYLISKEEWKTQCVDSHWCPPIRCNTHNTTIATTSIASLQQGRGVGCPACCPNQNPWSGRYTEFINLIPDGYTLLMSEDEWKQQCSNAAFCPPLHCKKHAVTIKTTRISRLQQETSGVGCPKCVRICNKTTEQIVSVWLQTKYITVGHNTLCGPGKTRFDFHLTFADFQVIVEVDGAQHFWNDFYRFSQAACERDLEKEEWAWGKGIRVIRVLQDDVFRDRLDWRGWISRCVESARQMTSSVEGGRFQYGVYTPDRPEYRSSSSVYYRLRTHKSLV